VEYLDVARDLILANTEAKARMALVLLDNAAEVILYRLSSETLSWDDFGRWVRPERFSHAKRREIDRLFPAKLELLEQEHSITGETSEVLRILHLYRNVAFHRDTHNPAVISVLARIGFKAVADLFVQTRAGIGLSGMGVFNNAGEWLSAYGLSDTYVDFGKAAIKIAAQLTVGAEPNLCEVQVELTRDLHERAAALRRLVNGQLPWKSSVQLNLILKWYEFKDAEPKLEDQLSEPFRSLRYRIAAGEAVDVSREKLSSLEQQFHDRYEARLEAYEQRIRYEDLEDVDAKASQIQLKATLGNILSLYSELDAQLSTLEKYLDFASEEWDRAVQHEIDVRRGK
jgi:hypothetical protein